MKIKLHLFHVQSSLVTPHINDFIVKTDSINNYIEQISNIASQMVSTHIYDVIGKAFISMLRPQHLC